MKRLSLVARLNLWYAAVLVLTVLVGLIVAELTTTWLVQQRQIALVERVEQQVRTVYRERGAEAVELEIEGVRTRIGEQQARSDGAWIETTTRLDNDVWLHLSVPDAIAQQTRRDARLGLLGGGGLALLIALFGGTWVTRRALRPIEDVASTAHRILAHGDRGERVPSPQTGDQLDRMVALFNELLDSNGRMIDAMRRSLDSIGHDLRTPLTRIRTSAELGLDGPQTAKQEALETALEEVSALETLLASLLDLTRAEAGMLQLQRQPLSLLDTCRRIVTLYEHVASDKQVELTLINTADQEVNADPARLQQAVANLVDNAIKFSEPGQRVQLRVVSQGTFAGIEVQDEGAGISADDLPRVFERLYRADRSRSTPGAGLGLSMVEAIAQAHRGRVEVQSTLGSGSTLTLWLPVDPS